MSRELAGLRSVIESKVMMAQLKKALPQNLTPERLTRQLITLMQNNPKLLSCSQHSILSGLMQAAELGLELTGPLGHCYLVPRKVKNVMQATFQLGWKGLVALAMRSGKVASFPIRTVYSNEAFSYGYGTSPYINHLPKLHDRGVPVAYYAICFYKEGGFDFEVMSVEQIQEWQQKYGATGMAWGEFFDQMAEKTVCRKLCRRLSLCPEAQQAATQDEIADVVVSASSTEEEAARLLSEVPVDREETLQEGETP